MPKLDTTLHLDMLRSSKSERSFARRLKQAIKVLVGRNDVYGLEWGDPESSEPLAYIRRHFLVPYLAPTAAVLEIGPGGGRWTRYMLDVKKLYVVDFYQELLDELKSNFRSPNLVFIKNNGNDFPGVTNESVDFIFSFGTFVHLDIEIIDKYLQNMKPLLKPTSNVVIHYADKTKPMGLQNKGFSQNDPNTMKKLVLSHGYFVYEEDVGTLWHSAVIRFGIRQMDVQCNTG